MKWLPDFRSYVLSKYPEEACGIIKNNEFIPITNVASNKLSDFQLDPISLIKIKKWDAVVHSHPYSLSDRLAYHDYHNPVYPSTKDQYYFQKGNVPWGIVSCDGEDISELLWMDENEIAPLLERKFIWGWHDCIATVRDWYRLNTKINFPNMVREWGFWETNQQPFLDNMDKWGFYEVPKQEIQIGDVLLYRTIPGSKSVNHSGIVVNEHSLITHYAGRLSELRMITESINSSMLALVCRHKEMK